MKLKVSEIPWYYRLNTRFFGTWEEELQKQTDKDRYDGPAKYLEVCQNLNLNPGLPDHENVLFWVRVGKDMYQQYVYQEKKWFKSKELVNGCYAFIPLTTKQSNIDNIIHVPRKFLKPAYERLKDYLEVEKSIRETKRSVTKCFLARRNFPN